MAARVFSGSALAALAIACGLSAASWTEVWQAGDTASGLFAVSEGGVTRVLRAGDQAVDLQLEPGADLFDLEATEEGWVATGGVLTPRGYDLWVLRRRGQVLESPPLPAAGEVAMRGNGVALVAGGRLVGLAWLEGDRFDALAVHAAPWTGEGWGPAEPVSAPATGSQIALAGAVLDNGDWLLAWSGFDGEDDETMWSRRREGRWSPPRRIHEDNRVPDITPSLVAVEGGALAAWSWFDGNDYRLRTARFDGGSWEIAPSFGERGSIDPTLLMAGGRAWLLHRTTAPTTWTVVEMDARGGRLRRAVHPEESPERPVVLPGAEAPRLLWPGAAARGRAPRAVRLSWEEMP